MSDISKRTKNVVNQIVEPKIKHLIQTLRNQYTDDYFNLSPDEKELISKKIMNKTLDETASLFMGTKRFNDPRFIYELSINNLDIITKFFEENELYSNCQMLVDARKLLENDISKMDNPQL